MKSFKDALEEKIVLSLKNNYAINNFDEFRFGNYADSVTNNKANAPAVFSVKHLKNIVKKLIGYNPGKKGYLENANGMLNGHSKGFENIWAHLNATDKELLLAIIAYRVMGYKKVKLPRNNPEYWNAIKTAKALADRSDTYDPHFMHFLLEKFDLNPIGFDVKFFFSEIGVAIDFILEQYAYKVNGTTIVSVESGATVLDIGGCWGDTALYFAYKAGKLGKVYSFEFIPDNIKLFKINTALNPALLPQIELVSHPVFNKSGEEIYFKDNGPGSKVAFEPFEGQTGTTTTVSIDDLVREKGIDKVDFIKMDIEGAEPMALQGAIETIKKFRPQLAIAIYHSIDDFVNIPNWILGLGLDYEIFLGHYTIHAEETICFAKPKSK
ncbi:MAG: FkbM family methyltransferase [Chitinophagaceae bacterium]